MAMAEVFYSRSDNYSVSQSGQLFEVFHVQCLAFQANGITVSFSLGGPSTSCLFDPRGGLGYNQTLKVASFVTNGMATVGFSGRATAFGADNSASANVTVDFLGFQDASGNAVSATLIPDAPGVPEPASWMLIGLGLVALIGKRRRLQF